MKKQFHFLFIASTLICASQLHSQNVLQQFWIPNARVNTQAQNGNILYLGGNFTAMRPHTGPATFIDLTTADPDYLFPRVTGPSGYNVNTVVPDGSGGWYFAGKFAFVGGVARNSLVHVLANNTVDPNWNPNMNSTGSVSQILISGSHMYVAGGFTNIGGQPRNNIAQIDLVTGAATAWNPNANNTVSAMVLSNNLIYVGGNFGNIGGQVRSKIAALDTVTGAAYSWNPVSNFLVTCLAMNNGTLYVGGVFTNIGTMARNCLAALDTATGIATSWNPNVAGSPVIIRAMAISGTKVFVGGGFNMIGSTTRNNLAAIDINTGIALAWNPNPNNVVYGLAVSGNTVYVGGDFTTISTVTRNYCAAIDASTFAALPWNPNSGGTVKVFYQYGTGVFVGGSFASIGIRARNYLAALDVTTGNLLPWNPGANNAVYGILPVGNEVYVAGGFTQLAGQSRYDLGAVYASTGTLDGSFLPTLSGPAFCLKFYGDKLYVGGDFAAGDNILAIDTATGSYNLAFAPNVNGEVDAIEISPSNNVMYIGGWFMSVGSQTRHYAAAINPLTGALLPWNPNCSSFVLDIKANWNTVYLGGDFSNVGSSMRNSLAAVDPVSGAVLPWYPNLNGASVNTMQLTSSTLYIGGNFSTINSSITRNNIAAIDLMSGLPTAWNPNSNFDIFSMLADYNNQRLYVGGDFTQFAGQLEHQYFAALNDSTNTIITGGIPLAENSSLTNANCFPNPLSSVGELQFNLDHSSVLSVELYDAEGQLIKTLEDKTVFAEGTYHYPVNAEGLPRGIYFYSIRSESNNITVKFIVE